MKNHRHGAPLYPYLQGAERIASIRQSGLLGSVPAPPLGQVCSPPGGDPARVRKAAGFAPDIGPLLVALSPGLALLPASSRRQLLPVGAFLLTGWVLWAPPARYQGC
jgi:hypothetical protein